VHLTLGAQNDNNALEDRDHPHVHPSPSRAGCFAMKRAFQKLYEGLVIERPALAVLLLLALLAAIWPSAIRRAISCS
jgi:hypothetical protein